MCEQRNLVAPPKKIMIEFSYPPFPNIETTTTSILEAISQL